jgi:hypothetical protein
MSPIANCNDLTFGDTGLQPLLHPLELSLPSQAAPGQDQEANSILSIKTVSATSKKILDHHPVALISG